MLRREMDAQERLPSKRSGRKPSPRTDAAEREIRRWMVQRHHRPGDRLPPDVELARMLGVARSTVIAALDRLERDGIIRRRQGSGTFVEQAPFPSEDGTGLETFEQTLALAVRSGAALIVQDVLVSPSIPAGAQAANALDIVPGTPITRLRLTAGSNGNLALSSTVSVRSGAGLEDIDDLEHRLRTGESLIDLLAEAGTRIAYARSEITARILDPTDAIGARFEATAPLPALQITDVAFRPNGSPVLQSVDIMRADVGPLRLIRQADLSRAAAPQAIR